MKRAELVKMTDRREERDMNADQAQPRQTLLRHNTSIAARRVIRDCYGFIIVLNNSIITIKTRQIAL